jgi:Nitrogen regulatory protein P-II
VKLLMLIIDGSHKEQLEAFLNRAGVVGYTEVPQTVGVGASGPRLGSRAFPKTSAIIFTILSADALDRLTADIKAYCADCGERLKMIVWGVEEVL